MNLYQQLELSNLTDCENSKWAWHLNLFSMTSVNKKFAECGNRNNGYVMIADSVQEKELKMQRLNIVQPSMKSSR